MVSANRLTQGEAIVGKLFTETSVDFPDSTSQVTAYHRYNLSAFSTAIQTNTGGGTASIVMRFENTDISNSISIVNNTKITPLHTGNYNIQFSAQMDKTDAGEDLVDIWLAINGTAVPYSNTRLALPKNDAKTVAAWNWITTLNKTDYAEIYWWSNDIDMRIYSEGAQTSPTRPGIPSVILTVWEI